MSFCKTLRKVSNYYSMKWIIEGTASAAANSGIDWKISKRHAKKFVNTEFYQKDGSLSNVEKYYRVHDYWIHSLPNIYAIKNLFKVNKNKIFDFRNFIMTDFQFENPQKKISQHLAT